VGAFKVFVLLIIVATMSFVVRLGDIVTDVKTAQQALSGSVLAEEKKEGKEPVVVPSGISEDEPAPLPEKKWADPMTTDMNFSETQTTVLKELKERRESLDGRELRANQREALLKVTEQRIEEKISEMKSIRVEIETLLGTQSDEEEARLQSLVKIYSGMKPKNAAAIFDNLDMNILLQVMGRMSERKSAPIMASMDVKKVQDLTRLLAEQKKLPDFPQ